MKNRNTEVKRTEIGGKLLSKGKKVRVGRNGKDKFKAEKERELIRSLIVPLLELLQGFVRNNP